MTGTRLPRSKASTVASGTTMPTLLPPVASSTVRKVAMGPTLAASTGPHAEVSRAAGLCLSGPADQDQSMAASQVDETERKFDVGTQTVFPNLTAAEGVASVEPPAELRLEAVYFDTPNHDLARHAMTLRRRTGGTDDGWTLKLPAGPDTRTEVRVPLGSDDDAPPLELRTRARAITRTHPLSPVVALSTTRREYALHDGDGTVLARVTDDSVRARLLQTDGPEQTWREWEVELDQGPEPVLDAVAEVLLAAGATPAATSSKLARALGETLGDEPPTHAELPAGTAGE